MTYHSADSFATFNVVALDSEENAASGSGGQWAEYVYTWTTVVLGTTLLVLYAITLYKAIKGTHFPFLIVLTVLLMLSNVGAISAAVCGHIATLTSRNFPETPT